MAALLAPEKMASFNYCRQTFLRIGTIADGNCLIHAALRAISDTYCGQSLSLRSQFVTDLRQELARLLTPGEYKNLSIEGGYRITSAFANPGTGVNISSSAEQVIPWTFATFAQFLATKQWLGEEFLDYFERTFDLEIVMLWYTKKDGMIPGIAKRDKQKYSRAIILLNIDNQHYETVGYQQGEKIHTLFSVDHRVIMALKSR